GSCNPAYRGMCGASGGVELGTTAGRDGEGVRHNGPTRTTLGRDLHEAASRRDDSGHRWWQWNRYCLVDQRIDPDLPIFAPDERAGKSIRSTTAEYECG